jgi:hypothetical protein
MKYTNLFILAGLRFPKKRKIYGLTNFEQGTKISKIRLTLVKTCYLQSQANALKSSEYKQILFEIIVEKEIFTAVSLCLISNFEPMPILISALSAMFG